MMRMSPSACRRLTELPSGAMAGSLPRHHRADGSRYGQSRRGAGRVFADEPTSRFQDVAFSPDGRAAWPPQVRLTLVLRTANSPPMTPLDANGLLLVFDLEANAVLWRTAGMRTGIIRDLVLRPPMAKRSPRQTTPTRSQSRDRRLPGGRSCLLRGRNRLVSYVAFKPRRKKTHSHPASWDSTVVVLGSSRAASRRPGFRATSVRYCPWRSALTAADWRPRSESRPSGSGTSRRDWRY